ncbi:hypothetical protein AVEN_227492-1 [Araneus ventricosus]|uniref:DUF4371 domain-containing protein n=1 Tax=Araneus ventricosus TaxID=182803 RepID=A0A4Y2C5C4_ARAVE|nr:hypothetical protein AVEN_227492-1 [Araneus ventricosus]
MEDKRIKLKMVKTDADAAHAQSMELLELNTMYSSTYTDTDIEKLLHLPVLFYKTLELYTISHVVERNKFCIQGKKLQNAVAESTKLAVSWSHLTGLYFDGRKDNTKVLIKKDTKYCPKIAKEEHYTPVNEPNSVYIGHVNAATGRAKAIKEAILNFFVSNNMQLNGLTLIGCDGTNVNTGHKGGIIRLMELASIDHYSGAFVCFKQMSYLSVIY